MTPRDAVQPEHTPAVSVVMPVRNEERHVGEAIHRILTGDYPANALELLVVDGGSSDGTAGIVAAIAAGDPRVRLLRNTVGTTPAGLNIGLARSSGEVIVRMDGHALPAADYVRRCVAALDRTGATAVGGHLVGRGETPFGMAVAAATSTALGAGDARFRRGGEGPSDTVYLGAWRRADLLRLGGFDEGLPRNQDYELCIRVRRSGGVVWLDPAIRSETVMRSSPSRLARQYFGYGLGRAATIARHPGSVRARQLVPAGLVAALAVCASLAPLARAPRLALRAVSGVYVGAVAVGTLQAGVKMRARDALWLPLVYALMHGSWGAGFWVGAAREVLPVCRRRAGSDRRQESGLSRD